MSSKNIRIYSHLIAYKEKADIPYEELAKKLNISVKALYGIVGNSVRFSSIYSLMKNHGYHEKDIPSWMKRPNEVEAGTADKEAEKATISPVEADILADEADQWLLRTEKPLLPPVSPTDTPPIRQQSLENASASSRLVGRLTGLQPVPPANSLGDVYDIRANSLEKQGIIQTVDGSYVQAKVGPDGGIYYERVEVPNTKTELNDIGMLISQVTLKELDLHVQSIVRKVGLNPTTFLSYAWLIGKDYFQGDLGDFLNFCVKFTLKFAFGARPGMIILGDSILRRLNEGRVNERNFDPL